MDWQAFVDNIDAVTCVISVEMKEDGHYGDICIVCGNEAYVKSIELASETTLTARDLYKIINGKPTKLTLYKKLGGKLIPLDEHTKEVKT
jgi:hypothetical protein